MRRKWLLALPVLVLMAHGLSLCANPGESDPEAYFKKNRAEIEALVQRLSASRLSIISTREISLGVNTAVGPEDMPTYEAARRFLKRKGGLVIQILRENDPEAAQPRLFDILARQEIRYKSFRSFLLVFARRESDLAVFYGSPPDTICRPLDVAHWYLCVCQER